MRQSYIAPLTLLEFQIDHYTDLLEKSRTDAERWFRRRELHRLKQHYKTLLN